MKRSWERPELIILMRKISDEVILVGCRQSGGGPEGHVGCYEMTYLGFYQFICDKCSGSILA